MIHCFYHLLCDIYGNNFAFGTCDKIASGDIVERYYNWRPVSLCLFLHLPQIDVAKKQIDLEDWGLFRWIFEMLHGKS